MSWMKRPRGSPAPAAGAGQTIFNPTQPPLPGAQSQPNQQPTWMGQQPPLPTPALTGYPAHAQQQPQQQQQFWQQPQPTANSYNSQPQQTYGQPNYQAHQPPVQNQYPNDYYQYDQQQYASQPTYQPQQNFQTYQNQEYNAPNTTQQPSFQSVQQNPAVAGVRQQGVQPNQWETTEADPWDWGWQDEANAQAQQNSNLSQHNSNRRLSAAQQNSNQQPNLAQHGSNQQSNLAQHGSNQQPNVAQLNLNQQPNHQTNQAQSLQSRMANSSQQVHQNIQQAPPANANILADSFANTADSWNWPAEEVAQPEAVREPTPQMHSRKSSHDNVTQRNVHVQKAPSPRPPDIPYPSVASAFAHVDSAIREIPKDDNKNLQLDDSFSVVAAVIPVPEPNVKTLNDREALIEHNIPNLALGRRFHADNLTPQWSIESQPSQDSSDGILSHTESSNRSEDPSRSSNKSSPGFNTNDNTNFNYAQPAENTWDHPYIENPSSLGNVQTSSVQDNAVNQELVNSVRTLSINRESVSPDKCIRNTQGDHVLPQADNNLPPQVLTPPVANLAQPPTNKIPQLPPSAAGFPPASTPNQNPFKRSGQLSHRNANVRVTPMQMMPTPDNVVPPMDPHAAQSSPFAQQELTPAIRQASPSLVSAHNVPAPTRNVQQAYSTANLETTPDNSERPDIPPPVNFRPMQYPHPVHQNTVENFEVAPSNDRNEYLQTGHLSDATYDNTNFTDEDISRNALQESYPPPGFRRMVLGQPESEFRQNSSFISDEPPPGLSRMVPGQLTDSSNIYTQPNDVYLDRQIDGQTTESESLNSSTYMNRAPTVYRQVDGQPTDEDSNYNQNVSSRSSSDRRPVGLDRMVPGESSSFNVQNFQSQNFSNASDERVVPGFGQSNASEPREQNMDGSDYSEVDTNQIRSVVGAVEVPEPRNIILDNPMIQNVVLEPELVQRDLDMEGENLQDLSAISTSEFPMIRDQNMDGADIQDEPPSRTVDILDSGSERPGSQKLAVPSREQAQHSEQKDRKYRDDTTGDESERDRYKNNRKEKERLKSSKERDTRYGDRRDERRTDKDRRGETISRSERERGDDRYRRGNRDARYETEDTDYYSDKDRRRYREGSYPSGKPPRPETSSRREEDSRRSYDPASREERDSRRRPKNADPRDPRYDPSDPRHDPRYDSYESERDGTISSRRRDRDKERYESREERDRRYARDERGYNSLRKNRSVRDDRKRDPRYPPRPDSRDPDPTEDELNETTVSKRDRRSVDRDREGDRSRQPRHRRERGYNQQYYERYGYSMDPAYQQQMYQHQQQTYQYYEKLRLSNPQAYLEIYNKYMAGRGLPANTQQDPSGSMAYGEGYASMPGYESASINRLGDERASVHSGRSSANGEIKERTLLDTSGNYYYTFRRIDPGAAYRQSTSSLRRRGSGSVHSLHTDHSGSREFNTDSINLGLENSTVKSERMTPVKFATAHIKGIISSTNLVTINPCYPVDGQPAIVEILDLNKILINDPVRCELTAYPGPLVKGVTHKKTVIEYCEAKIRNALDSLSSPLFHNQTTSHNIHNNNSHHNNNSSSGHNSHSERPPVVSSSSLPANADLGSYVLMWELLILLLRQNGMVVGTDIAELLVKNKRQFEWRGAGAQVRHLSRRGSTSSVTSRSAEMPVEEVPPHQGEAQVDGAEDSSNDASLSARRTERAQQNSSLIRNTARRTSSNTNILESSSQEKYITDRFREYLLFGSGKEALEWAMSHGLWGHALFLASKMDRRTYANVMTRFANGLAANDPLQTLYQLMSGRQPASVTCVLDEKWGDWRPHLAMILSNTSQRPELDRKSITQLGDTLQSRGDTYGAHFCYLMSREEFHPSRLQLLGLAPPLPAAGRTPSYAIIMTEIYEYACTLSQDNFTLGHFQFYKYLLATRLVDCGLYDRALFYMESIANVVAQSPDQYQTSFVERVLEMGDRLKHYDPEENVGELLEDTDQYGDGQYGQEGHLGQGRTNEKSWITTLRRVLNDLNSGAILHEPQSLQSQTPVEYDQPNIQQLQHQQVQLQNNPNYQQQTSINQQQWNQNTFQQPQQALQQPSYDQFQLQKQLKIQQQQQFEQQQLYQQEDKQLESLETDGIPQMYDPTAQGGIVVPSPPSSNSYIPPISQYGSYGDQSQLQEGEGDPQNNYRAPVSSSDSGYWNHDQQQNNYGYEDREGLDALEPSRPQISMPNMARGKSPYDEDQDPADSNSSSQLAPKAADGKKKEAPVGKNQSSGWFGGIFNKLSLKPKNQMILPDDKNPSIVWDSDKKKWTNLDADEDEQQAQVGLPPKMSDIMRPSANNNNISYQPQMPSGHTPPAPSYPAPPEHGAMPPNPAAPIPNIFKLQKGRHIKKSYVDVFNPSGAPMKPLPPASEVLGASLQSPAPTSYFVPGASNNNNEGGAPTFYNPANY